MTGLERVLIGLGGWLVAILLYQCWKLAKRIVDLEGMVDAERKSQKETKDNDPILRS